MSNELESELTPHFTLPLQLDRTARILGLEKMKVLARSRVSVIGLGGVGSFAVEALARSGVGSLTLVDHDAVSITNLNRQLHALHGVVGQTKSELMEERVRSIHRDIDITEIKTFYDEASSDHILGDNPDIVIDCIDNISAKLHLLSTCLHRNIPVITALGAGGKIDPTLVTISPLPKSHNDRLGKIVRKTLRNKCGFKNADLRKITAIWSPEKAALPVDDYDSAICGNQRICPGEEDKHPSCTKRYVVLGSLVTVTATFGLFAASAAIKTLTT